MNLYVWALLAYSVFLMGLGLFMSRRVKSSADFLVAGRSLGPGRLFATFLAANIGAGSTVGATGLGYRLGMSAWWWVGSAAVGTLLLSQFLGPRLWTLAKQHNLSTLQDFLEFRYGRSVKALISVLFWFGALAILAAQLIAISWILNTVGRIRSGVEHPRIGAVAGHAVALQIRHVLGQRRGAKMRALVANDTCLHHHAPGVRAEPDRDRGPAPASKP